MYLSTKQEKAVEVKQSLNKPTQPGVYHRLLILTGGQRGEVYYLKGNRIVIGRDGRADILLRDMGCSRQHAEISKLEEGYVLTDLKSNNKTYVNYKEISQHPLVDGDCIVIGKSVIKYEVIKIEALQAKKRTTKKKSKNKVGFLFLLLLVIILLPDEGTKVEKKEVKKETPTAIFKDTFAGNLERNLAGKASAELEKEVDMIIHRGKREYREKNYYRAVSEFKLALLMRPDNADAAFFLRRAKMALDQEIRLNLIKVQYDKSALKYSEAVVSYCTIIRLIQNFSGDSYYDKLRTKIDEELRDLEPLMGLGKGEIKCFETAKTDLNN